VDLYSALRYNKGQSMKNLRYNLEHLKCAESMDSQSWD